MPSAVLAILRKGAALLVALAAASACGGNVVVDGTSDGGDPCSTGADCAQCPDRSSCFTCNGQVHPAGLAAFDALLSCVLCTGCFTACEPLAQAMCPAPPVTKGPCDDGTFEGDAQCQTCQQCSMSGSCEGVLVACKGIPDCGALASAVGACPSP